MRATIVANLERRMGSIAELLAVLEPGDLVAKLEVPRHKSVADHLWCIVGARESYAAALRAGTWQGFSCTLRGMDHASFERALTGGAAALLAAIGAVADWSDERDALLAAVAEHEVMHEGQLIRHMYGLGKSLPASWRWA